MIERPPPHVEQALARSVAAFLRSAPNQQIPARLRRFKGIRPKGLGQHRAELVGVLEDVVLRRQILEWLDGRNPLARSDADLLRLAVERPEGWSDALGAGSKPKGSQGDGTKVTRLEAAVEREQGRSRRAKDEAIRAKDEAIRAKEEARRAKEEARRTVSEERSKAGELSKEVARLEGELTAAERKVKETAAEASRAGRARERAERRARTSVAKAEAERDASVREMRTARRDASAALARVERLEAELEASRNGAPKAKKKTVRAGKPKAPARRRPLPVPKGRFEDDPETLREWLGVPGVLLLVDGYNVTKAEGGFGELSLELQRDRLVEGVSALSLKTKVGATIVFDGSTVPPGIASPRKRRIKVVYSKDETADDHIVALLEKLPPDPVVLTTNDKELQARAEALGATAGTSGQLLALLR
ncbi:MAG: NYN domain-containing protein [Actinomycetota bacterium]|nr:NYN domain-containing protein [Actinomycetota bacterium]